MTDADTQQPQTKPFYTRWWFITAAILVGLVIFSSIGGGPASDTTGESTAVTSDSQATAPDQANGESVEAADDIAAPANFYLEEYGSFEVLETSGTGDSVVRLPEGATYGVVSATHTGSSNFAIQALDASNGLSGLLVNTIGAYDGVTALGFSSFGDPADKLEISANGEWTLTITPVAQAASLPATGSGDGVFTYDGPAPIWDITHQGSSNFSVIQNSPNSLFGLLVNEIGSYSGSVTGVEGPSVIIISADGQWTFTEQ